MATTASSDPATGDLDTATAGALVASRALLGLVAVSLQPVLDRVTLTQFRVLVLLDAEGPSRSGALAERLGVHPSTFSRTTDRMVTSGLLRRIPSPDSRREVLVNLTAKGRRLVTIVMNRRTRLLREVLEPLSPTDRQKVIDGMQILAAAMDEPTYDEDAGLLGA
jgi:DNA-binding MarR family transcriptional regulator